MTDGVELAGAKEFAAALKRVKGRANANLRKSNRTVAKKAQGHARAAASGGTRQQQRAATGITAVGTTTAAVVKIGPTVKAPFARGAFFGAKKFPQFLPWVGANWKPATHGEGPYRVNDAFAQHQGEYEDDFLNGQVAAASPPFR